MTTEEAVASLIDDMPKSERLGQFTVTTKVFCTEVYRGGFLEAWFSAFDHEAKAWRWVRAELAWEREQKQNPETLEEYLSRMIVEKGETG
jgi:hypothetical protein